MPDRRDHERVQELFRDLGVEGRPMVGRSDLADLDKLRPAFKRLTFPIESVGDLVDQLGGSDAKLDAGGVQIPVGLMSKRVPAHYFPISSQANLIEKVAALIRENRPRIDVNREVAGLREQTSDLSFPIQDRDDLVRKLGPKRWVRFRGGRVEVRLAAQRVPPEVFPIRSRAEFEKKIAALMTTVPLIVSD